MYSYFAEVFVYFTYYGIVARASVILVSKVAACASKSWRMSSRVIPVIAKQAKDVDGVGGVERALGRDFLV